MSLSLQNIPKGKILVAVSGGVDSCVLLDLIARERKEGLFIVHVNHSLRGKNSDEDEAFVKALAQQYKIPYYSKKLEVAPRNEEEGRKERYTFFDEIMKKEGIEILALAHHKDDQVETLLLQMIRGTQGFSPMKEFSKEKWRPLLTFSKSELISYAQENKLPWREDESNQENEYSRNILRNLVIPEIKKMNSAFEEGFLRFAFDINNLQKDITIEAQKFSGKELPRELFLGLPLYLQKAIIKILNPSLYSKHIEEVISMIDRGVGRKEKHGITLEKGVIKLVSEKSEQKPSLLKLILASQSPQRRRLLENIGYDFEVIPSNYDEIWDNQKSIEENIQMFGEEKAKDVLQKYGDATVIGCDTFVVHPEFGVYLKPKDETDARRMLFSYSGRTVEVLSGIAVMNKNILESRVVKTLIEFSEFTEKDVDIWLEKGEWQGRSGACSIEGYTSRFVRKIDGCFFNIVGLPTQVLQEMLEKVL